MPNPENHTLAPRDPRETARLEAFSDGVFAIAITLLILQIPIPAHSRNLPHELLHIWPSYLAYTISFVVILIMWVNHHTVFRLVDRIDRRFLMINGMLLMFITFVNYPTELLANYLTTDQARTAMIVYSGTFVMVAIWFNVFWRYATFNGRLVSPTANSAAVDAITRAYRYGPLFYAAGFVTAFVSVPVSLTISAGLALYYAVYGLRDEQIVDDQAEPMTST